MTILYLLPVVLSFLVLGAHFLRAGGGWTVALCLGLIALLALRRRWIARGLQVALVLAAVEWVRTLVVFTQARLAAGLPAARLVAILAGVAVFTLASALVFQTRRLRRVYGLETAAPAAPSGETADA